MAEIQMVQLRGQTTGVSSKTKTGSQFDFSGMLKEVSQSASETKKPVRSTGDESAKAVSRDKVQETKKENEQITDSEDENMVEEDGKAEESASLTGEEIVQLSGMMMSLLQNQQEGGELSEQIMQTEEARLAVEELSVEGDSMGQVEVSGTGNGEQGVMAIAGDSEGVDEDSKEQNLKMAVDQSQDSRTAKQAKAETQQADKHVLERTTNQTAGHLTSATGNSQISGLPSMADQTGTTVLKTTPDTLPEDITKTITTNMLSKHPMTSLEVTLEPATLGKITIKLIYEEGRAALSLISDNARTLEILSQNAGDIAQILQEQTGEDTVVYTPEGQYTEEDAADKEHGGRQQEQEQKQNTKQEQAESFMQQLRLGLI